MKDYLHFFYIGFTTLSFTNNADKKSNTLFITANYNPRSCTLYGCRIQRVWDGYIYNFITRTYLMRIQ